MLVLCIPGNLNCIFFGGASFCVVRSAATASCGCRVELNVGFKCFERCTPPDHLAYRIVLAEVQAEMKLEVEMEVEVEVEVELGMLFFRNRIRTSK
jgi:hypothetical protein